MTHMRWLALLLAGVTGFLPAAVQAQAFPRGAIGRKEYVHFKENSDLRQILSNKLLEMRGRLELDRLRKVYGDKLKLSGFDKWNLPGLDTKDIANPALRKQIKELLKRGQQDAKIDPEGAKAIESLIKKPPVPAKENPLNPQRATEPSSPQRVDNLQPNSGPGPNDPTNPLSGPGTVEPDLQEKLSDWAQKLAKRLEGTGLRERLSESPAWHKGMESLQGYLSEHSGRFSLPSGGLESFSKHLPKNWDSLLPNLDRLHLPEFALPSLERAHFKVDVPHFKLSAPRLPGGVPGGGGVGFGATQAALWFGLIVLLGLLLWRLTRGSGWQTKDGAATAWRLGPWPVNPALVCTRAELVQAFEYLALLRLGQEARTWNHREIAAHLSGADADQERAARELATLYEQARYAPGDEPLAVPDLETARRNLCYLAGVATA